jgi:hypothetical protein
MRQETRASLAAEREPDPALHPRKPPRTTRPRRQKRLERLGEGASSAGEMVAVEASDLKAEPHRLSEARQVGGMALVAAVHGGADGAAARAASVMAAVMAAMTSWWGSPRITRSTSQPGRKQSGVTPALNHLTTSSSLRPFHAKGGRALRVEG